MHLNAAMELYRNGALARHGVKLIGANAQAIAKGEDRQLFRKRCCGTASSAALRRRALLVDANRVAGEIGTFPLIIRPAFTLGGMGRRHRIHREELTRSPHVVSIIASQRSADRRIPRRLKEFEMEVMRDRSGQLRVVARSRTSTRWRAHWRLDHRRSCATLTDKEYQMMRDALSRSIREIGVETGGSNIQFAVHRTNGRMSSSK